MNALDRLAYSAADAIDVSVATVPVPTWGAASARPFAGLARTAGYALAGAAAAVLAVVALLVVSPPSEETIDNAPPTVTATTTDVTPTSVTPTTDPSVDITVPPTSIPSDPVPVVPVVPGTGNRAPGADTEAPEIVIVAPSSGAHTTAERVVVEGYTEIGAALSTDDGERIRVDHEGKWSHPVALEIGVNVFGFVATDAAGNIGSASIEIVRDAPRPTTTTTKPRSTTTTTDAKTWEFTAHNTYGFCAEDPPYDIFHGTGKPGTEISVTSEYGGGGAVVGENGRWEVKVFFPEAPKNVEFAVKVTDFTGARKTFTFVHTE